MRVGHDNLLTYRLSCNFLGLSSSGQMSLSNAHVAPAFFLFFPERPPPELEAPSSDSSPVSPLAVVLPELLDPELELVVSAAFRLAFFSFFFGGESASEEDDADLARFFVFRRLSPEARPRASRRSFSAAGPSPGSPRSRATARALGLGPPAAPSWPGSRPPATLLPRSSRGSAK